MIFDSLSVEIAYAYVGNSLNPQAKILSVNYNWNSRNNFYIKVNYFFKNGNTKF
jgi:hypothetical protein